MTKTSKTSRLCTWNVPSGSKVNVQPIPAAEMTFKQSHYTSVTSRDFEKEKESFLSFSTTLHESQCLELADESKLRERLYSVIKDDILTSRFTELMEKRPLNRPAKECFNLPDTLIKYVNAFRYNNEISSEKNVKIFVQNISITPKQIKDLAIVTKTQSKCTEWMEHKQGRITASNFHRVFTRAMTMKKKPDENPKVLVDTILGLNKVIETKALKHGLALEPHAKRKYVYEIKKTRSHKNFTHSDIGLVIDEKYPYLGASPDMEVECDCCGKGLVEIKCPYSILDQVPSA